MNKRTILVGQGLAACVAALAVSRFYPSEAAPQELTTLQAVPVNEAKAQVGDVPIVLTGIGSVEPYNVVESIPRCVAWSCPMRAKRQRR